MVKEEMRFDCGDGLQSANCAIFDKSGTNVFVASEDHTIKVFNLATGAKEGELKGHEDAVLDLTWDSGK
jgi:WD40 repeat protein